MTQRIVLAVVPALAAAVIRLLGATLRYEEVCAAGMIPGDRVAPPSIFCFWHHSLLVCAHRFRGRGIAILISRSFDGELIARTVERLGFVAVRGSSSRGGSVGLRGLERAYGEGLICAITADGPKGPALVAKPGAAQLAELVGAGWVGAFEARPERAWVLRTWDGFLIPKPFSRVWVAWPEHAVVTGDAGEMQTGVQAALERAVGMAGRAARGGERV